MEKLRSGIQASGGDQAIDGLTNRKTASAAVTVNARCVLEDVQITYSENRVALEDIPHTGKICLIPDSL